MTLSSPTLLHVLPSGYEKTKYQVYVYEMNLVPSAVIGTPRTFITAEHFKSAPTRSTLTLIYYSRRRFCLFNLVVPAVNKKLTTCSGGHERTHYLTLVLSEAKTHGRVKVELKLSASYTTLITKSVPEVFITTARHWNGGMLRYEE